MRSSASRKQPPLWRSEARGRVGNERERRERGREIGNGKFHVEGKDRERKEEVAVNGKMKMVEVRNGEDGGERSRTAGAVSLTPSPLF